MYMNSECFFCITIFILNPIKDKTKQTFYLALFLSLAIFKSQLGERSWKKNW